MRLAWASLAILAHAQDFSLDSIHAGFATYYNVDLGRGSCSLPSSQPWDTLSLAINDSEYRNSELCGACMVVRGPKDSVLLRVNDRCPGCKAGDLDLTRTAFAHIAETNKGTVPVTWHFAACPDTPPLSLLFTPKSSRWYINMQPLHHAYPIKSLELLVDSAWVDVPRLFYNHFAVRRPPPAPWAMRLRDTQGHEWIDSTVTLTPGLEQAFVEPKGEE